MIMTRRCCHLHVHRNVKVRQDLELLEALAAFLQFEDAEIARLRPTIIVAEFAGMMEAAIDLRQELTSLQRFRLNFATSPMSSSPSPAPSVRARRC
jgi:predicted unusual protein kinase regulating ubiquinone biosynthesis (AarF/ABC1/UbiB family)